jgi:nucleoside-diphosphate-sugar epimerase
MLAHEFSDYKDDNNIIIFAAGVSNSNETRESEFEREKELLVQTTDNISSEKIIYFSTCAMYDTYFDDNKYTKHKLYMESYIKKNVKNFIIVRLSQVMGKSNNKQQLMGFLYDKILNNEEFELFNIDRNIIDVHEVKKILEYILVNHLFNRETINIANPKNINMVTLVHTMENILKKKAIYSIKNLEGSFCIDIEKISSIMKKLNLFKPTYMRDILKMNYE